MSDFIGDGPERQVTQSAPPPGPVVFGVGMPLTGGQRFAEALEILGYKTRVGGSWARKLASAFLTFGDWRILRHWTRGGHRAWVDWPIHCYRRLHQRFPDAHWILTVRNVEEWLDEWREHVGVLRKRAHRRGVAGALEANRNLFGSKLPSIGHSEEAFRQAYYNVKLFLDNEDKSWLEMDLAGGDADWPALCAVLKTEVPSCPFPGTERPDVVQELRDAGLNAWDEIGDPEKYIQELR